MKKFSLLTLFLMLIIPFTSQAWATPSKNAYEPTHDSVAAHPLPEWYQDAKFGVIIHYGLYSVPGWAPIFNPVGKVFTKEFFTNNPYAEWYANTLQIKNSPTYRYHAKTFGANFKYDDFALLFNKEVQKWNADNWSQLFADAGVKYVVFVTKHHDGFLLWPSKNPNPYKPQFMVQRDVVGELTRSVRNHGLRMGLYYSGGYDWSWPEGTPGPITDVSSAISKIPQSLAYSDYVFKQYEELLETYHPDLFWNDIALPSNTNKWKIFSDFYNAMPEGVVNNRWGQGDTFDFSIFGQPYDFMLDIQLKKDWFDYYSPEYIPKYMFTKHKWEADHGIGYSFGFNREEDLHRDHLKTLDQLIEDLADLVSKNGNLLLGIGPEADGTIPEYQRHLLLGIGEWLRNNGEAIYATKPWRDAEGKANNGAIPVRFTQSKDEKYLYIILLKNPQGKDVVLNHFILPFKRIEVLNGKEPIGVRAQRVDESTVIYLSQIHGVGNEHPMVLRLEREYVN